MIYVHKELLNENDIIKVVIYLNIGEIVDPLVVDLHNQNITFSDIDHDENKEDYFEFNNTEELLQYLDNQESRN